MVNGKKELEELENDSTLPDIDISIDDLLKRGLVAIYGIMRASLLDAKRSNPHRHSVSNLRDCMNMLMDLKKMESTFLDNASDEELEKLLDKPKK